MLRNLPTTTLSADPLLTAVSEHFAEHGYALCNAAGRINGVAGTARVLRLMAALRNAARLDRTTRYSLVELHRLLSLDLVAEDLEPDSWPWVLLDPANSEVEDLCLLTDRLFDLLIEIGKLDDEREAMALVLNQQDAA